MKISQDYSFFRLRLKYLFYAEAFESAMTLLFEKNSLQQAHEVQLEDALREVAEAKEQNGSPLQTSKLQVQLLSVTSAHESLTNTAEKLEERAAAAESREGKLPVFLSVPQME